MTRSLSSGGASRRPVGYVANALRHLLGLRRHVAAAGEQAGD
jgi:hypothetical protein